jgi:hypothetical protein
MRHVAQVGNCSTILYLAFPRWLNTLLSQRPTHDSHIMCVCLNLNLDTQNDKWRHVGIVMLNTRDVWLVCSPTLKLLKVNVSASRAVIYWRFPSKAQNVEDQKLISAAWETERASSSRLESSLFLVALPQMLAFSWYFFCEQTLEISLQNVDVRATLCKPLERAKTQIMNHHHFK